MTRDLLVRALDRAAENNRPITFWLRDDDATEPTNPLEQLLELTAENDVPVTLAVIPAGAGQSLSARLEDEPLVTVAVHGWSHQNHAPEGEKKQELGSHRDPAVVLAEIDQGRKRLEGLFGERAFPMLVPPWNRIDRGLLPALPPLGIQALSTFGRENGNGRIPLLNTHIDIIDWHGTRGGRSEDLLFGEVLRRIGELSGHPLDTIGILSHHLVHDASAWRFLETLFELTRGHPGCRWMRSEAIVRTAQH
ncbi:polysaccharide deacetylase family protein [Neorhizobium phenanthreniclasticum]|uniref:polysaccharide deacetylase family protein n=1 Tax=Neorhizobium phenanthreniclasticum TaxID=3157917 RepID=UPI0039F53ABC